MSGIKIITYAESREAFFVKKLKQAEKALDNLVKYGTDHVACAEKGEIVSFYQDALSALKEKQERDKGCEICNGGLPCDNGCDGFCDICDIPEVWKVIHKTGQYNYCPMCGRQLTEVDE